MSRGRCLLVGGHSRGVGKTALVVELLRALHWPLVFTVKVSSHRHGVATVIHEDQTPSPHTSTGRCLEAGAERAFLCRCPDERLADAARLVRELRAAGSDVIVESNRMSALVEASLTFFVASDRISDWKTSSAVCLSQADAVVTSAHTRVVPGPASRVTRLAGGTADVLRFSDEWRVPGLAPWVESRLAQVSEAARAGCHRATPPGVTAPA